MRIRIAADGGFCGPTFDYHHGANAGAATGRVLFPTFEGCELWHLMLVPSFLESQEAAPGRPGHRFGSAADTHLGEDRFTVRFHRPFCDKKGCRNLFIALSLCHQL